MYGGRKAGQRCPRWVYLLGRADLIVYAIHDSKKAGLHWEKSACTLHTAQVDRKSYRAGDNLVYRTRVVSELCLRVDIPPPSVHYLVQTRGEDSAGRNYPHHWCHGGGGGGLTPVIYMKSGWIVPLGFNYSHLPGKAKWRAGSVLYQIYILFGIELIGAGGKHCIRGGVQTEKNTQRANKDKSKHCPSLPPLFPSSSLLYSAVRNQRQQAKSPHQGAQNLKNDLLFGRRCSQSGRGHMWPLQMFMY